MLAAPTVRVGPVLPPKLVAVTPAALIGLPLVSASENSRQSAQRFAGSASIERLIAPMMCGGSFGSASFSGGSNRPCTMFSMTS